MNHAHQADNQNSGTDLINPDKKSIKSKKIKLLISLLILLIFFIYTFYSSSSSVKITAETDYVTLTAPSGGLSVTILYQDIQSIEIMEDFNPGTCISGKENRSYSYGTWKNDRLGEYTLMISKKVSHCVVIKTANKTVVFNAENNNTTDQFEDYFKNLAGIQ